MSKRQKRKLVEYALIGSMGGMAASGFVGPKLAHVEGKGTAEARV